MILKNNPKRFPSFILFFKYIETVNIFISSDVGFRMVVSILMVVDLSAPFGPRKAKIEPVSTLKMILFTAVKSSNFFVRI